MARREWAEELVASAQRRYPNANTLNIAALVAVKEHARAVRVVKADLAAVKRDRHNYSVTTRVELVKRLERLLAALTQGRA